MSTDVAKTDAQWLASLSDVELRQRVENSCQVIFENFPAGAPVVFDLRVYEGGIRSIQGVPSDPSIHVVALLSEGTNGSPPSTLCVGVFIATCKRRLIRIQYTDDTASLRVNSVKVSLDTEDRQNHFQHHSILNVGERGVALYTEPHAKSWRDLAGGIDEDFLIRDAGVEVNMPVLLEHTENDIESNHQSCLAGSSTADMAANYSQNASLSECRFQQLRFKPLPAMRRPEGMRGSQLTEFHMDRSAYVMWLIATRYSGRMQAILSELQLSFVSFLLLRSIAGLQHWVALVLELSNCDDLITDSPELMGMFMACLAVQLRHLDSEVLDAFGDEFDSFRSGILALVSTARSRIFEASILADVVRDCCGWVPSAEHI